MGKYETTTNEIISAEGLVKFEPGELLTWKAPSSGLYSFNLLARTPKGLWEHVFKPGCLTIQRVPGGHPTRIPAYCSFRVKEEDRLLYIDRKSQDWCVCLFEEKVLEVHVLYLVKAPLL